jgi:hypothetical protein
LSIFFCWFFLCASFTGWCWYVAVYAEGLNDSVARRHITMQHVK